MTRDKKGQAFVPGFLEAAVPTASGAMLAGPLFAAQVPEPAAPVEEQRPLFEGCDPRPLPDECPNCAGGDFAMCPRCYAETGFGCGHGALCPECDDEAAR
jgi:hypothetical protein